MSQDVLGGEGSEMERHKTCSKCKINKPENEFYKDNHTKDKLYPQCRLCKKAAINPEQKKLTHKKWRNNNRDHMRNQSYLKLYGITLEQYNKILKIQNNTCAICNDAPNIKRTSHLYVDHDHNTKRIRGLLCIRCNCALGYFKDKPSLLSKAVNYIQKGGINFGTHQSPSQSDSL